MIVGGYSMDLYCETGDGIERVYEYDSQRVLRDQFGHEHGFSGHFYAQTFAQCAAQAKHAGWRLRPKMNQALCPVCVAENRKLPAVTRKV